MRKKIAMLVVTVLVCLLVFPSYLVGANETEEVKITKLGVASSRTLNVREGAGYEFEVKDKMSTGDFVEIIDIVDDWYLIKTEDEEDSYVLRERVDILARGNTIINKTGYITVDLLNVRGGASLDDEIVGGLKYGEDTRIVRKRGDWYLIQYEGETAYVYADYVSFEKPAERVIYTAPSTNNSGSQEAPLYSAPADGGYGINVEVTAYCACSSCNGPWAYMEDGIWCSQTASGIILKNASGYGGAYCAASPAVGSLGQYITINDTTYKIVDRLGSDAGYRVDIFMTSHSACYDFGRRNLVGYVG